MFSVQAKSKDDPASLIRPSELPIYDDPAADNEYEFVQRPAGALESSVRDLRHSLTSFLLQYKDTYDYANHVIETGKAHTAGTVDYLQDETNLGSRATFITAGGLVGLLVAALRRRGIVKRLLYTGVGLAVPASVCYPDQTAAYSRWGYDESKKGAVIAYNFLVGAKPEEEAPKAAPPAPKPAPKPEPVETKPAAPAPPPAAAKPAKVVAPVVDDPGQSNPEDADLYTTRG